MQLSDEYAKQQPDGVGLLKPISIFSDIFENQQQTFYALHLGGSYKKRSEFEDSFGDLNKRQEVDVVGALDVARQSTLLAENLEIASLNSKMDSLLSELENLPQPQGMTIISIEEILQAFYIINT